MAGVLDALVAVIAATVVFIAEHPLQIAGVAALVFSLALTAALFVAPELAAPRKHEHPDAD